MSTNINYDNLLTNNLANVAGIFNDGANIVFSTLFISDLDEEEYDHGNDQGNGPGYVEVYTVANQYLIAVEEKDGEYIFYTCRHKISNPDQLCVIDKYYSIKVESLKDFMSHYFYYDYPQIFFDHLTKSDVSDLKEKVQLALMEIEVKDLLPTDFSFKVSDPNFLHEILKGDWRFMEEPLNRIINSVSQFAPSQFAYVDEKGNNILMTYCSHVDGWEKELVEIDIQVILNNMPYSTFALNHEQKNALELARENLEQLVKKMDSRHIVEYLEPLFKV